MFLAWWSAALEAGMLVYLDARDPADKPATLGGLILYRHGNRLSTVHSADAPGVRDSHPGVMHLLRWRAIQLAIREGCDEMDLGGVDTGPDHAEPGEGHPMAGLYEHKRLRSILGGDDRGPRAGASADPQRDRSGRGPARPAGRPVSEAGAASGSDGVRATRTLGALLERFAREGRLRGLEPTVGPSRLRT